MSDVNIPEQPPNERTKFVNENEDAPRLLLPSCNDPRNDSVPVSKKAIGFPPKNVIAKDMSAVEKSYIPESSELAASLKISFDDSDVDHDTKNDISDGAHAMFSSLHNFVERKKGRRYTTGEEKKNSVSTGGETAVIEVRGFLEIIGSRGSLPWMCFRPNQLERRRRSTISDSKASSREDASRRASVDSINLPSFDRIQQEQQLLRQESVGSAKQVKAENLFLQPSTKQLDSTKTLQPAIIASKKKSVSILKKPGNIAPKKATQPLEIRLKKKQIFVRKGVSKETLVPKAKVQAKKDISKKPPLPPLPVKKKNVQLFSAALSVKKKAPVVLKDVHAIKEAKKKQVIKFDQTFKRRPTKMKTVSVATLVSRLTSVPSKKAIVRTSGKSSFESKESEKTSSKLLKDLSEVSVKKPIRIPRPKMTKRIETVKKIPESKVENKRKKYVAKKERRIIKKVPFKTPPQKPELQEPQLIKEKTLGLKEIKDESPRAVSLEVYGKSSIASSESESKSVGSEEERRVRKEEALQKQRIEKKKSDDEHQKQRNLLNKKVDATTEQLLSKLNNEEFVLVKEPLSLLIDLEDTLKSLAPPSCSLTQSSPLIDIPPPAPPLQPIKEFIPQHPEPIPPYGYPTGFPPITAVEQIIPTPGFTMQQAVLTQYVPAIYQPPMFQVPTFTHYQRTQPELSVAPLETTERVKHKRSKEKRRTKKHKKIVDSRQPEKHFYEMEQKQLQQQKPSPLCSSFNACNKSYSNNALFLASCCRPQEHHDNGSRYGSSSSRS